MKLKKHVHIQKFINNLKKEIFFNNVNNYDDDNNDKYISFTK